MKQTIIANYKRQTFRVASITLTSSWRIANGDAIYRYTLHIIQASALRLQQVSKLDSDYDEIKLILVRWLDPNLIKYSKRVFENPKFKPKPNIWLSLSCVKRFAQIRNELPSKRNPLKCASLLEHQHKIAN